MKVAVIGAGISGLGAARRLAQAGWSVVVYEKSAGIGGRCATRRIEGYTFDTGATSIAPRGKALEPVMLEELDTSDLVQVLKPIWTMEYGRVAPGAAAKMALARYTYRSGITKLAKLLAEGLDVRLNQAISQIERMNGGWCVAGEVFDIVIISAPAPQAATLLESAGERRALTHAHYRSCLSILLGYAHPFDAPYHALIEPEQRSPVIWISAESVKSPDRAPEGHSAFVVQLGSAYSTDHYEDSDYEITHEALVSMERLFGKPFGTAAVSQVKRWRYSQPEITCTFDHVNPPGSTLLVVGDVLAGPRIELAYESGLHAARHLLEEPHP